MSRQIYYRLRRRAKLFLQRQWLAFQPGASGMSWRNKGKKILIFCPEAAIKPHFDAMQVLGKMLENGGAEVRWIHCNGGILRCPAHDMKHVPWTSEQNVERLNTCTNCRWEATRNNLLTKKQAISLDKYILPAPLFESKIQFSGKKIKNFQWQGIKIGELVTSAARMLLKKEPTNKISSDYKNYWLQTCRSSIQVYQAMGKLIREWKPNLMIHYDQYPLLISARLAAEHKGIQVRTVAHTLLNGIDRSKVQIFKSTYNSMIRNLVNLWPKYRKHPLCWKQAEVSVDDLLCRMQGGHTHVFSRPYGDSVENLKILNTLKQDQKVLLAFTSSEDEVGAEVAIQKTLKITRKKCKTAFVNQLQWLRWLRKFADKTGHLVVVRVHPREGGTIRNTRASENLEILKTYFQESSKNFYIIWPEIKISSYDLFHFADVVTYSFSTIGLEAARCGIRAITGFGPPCYEFPSLQMLKKAGSIASYEKTLSQWLRSSGPIKQFDWEEVYKWHYLITKKTSIELDKTKKLNFLDCLKGFIKLTKNIKAKDKESPCKKIAEKLNYFFAKTSNPNSKLIRRLQKIS